MQRFLNIYKELLPVKSFSYFLGNFDKAIMIYLELDEVIRKLSIYASSVHAKFSFNS